MTEPTAPVSVDEVRELLDEVLRTGAPAHRDHARVLLMRLDMETRDEALINAALLLTEAFRNDPYLWR